MMRAMNTHRPMIDALESRWMMSATLATSADPDEGGEVTAAQYATASPTTSADPDEGGEITAATTTTTTTLARPLTYKLVYNRAS